VARWLGSQGMKCSVYAAQYLLEGLLENGEEAQALALITAPGDRSWRHMVESGATITWEAWDQRYKPNLDWTHAWGAAPANLLPRFLLGAQPLTPGWSHALIRPHPGTVEQARGKVPTAIGPISIEWRNAGHFRLSLALPPGMSAQVVIPARKESTSVLAGGKPARARRDGQWWILEEEVTGNVVIEAN
jgi:alpha-L-rhamnosidase